MQDIVPEGLVQRLNSANNGNSSQYIPLAVFICALNIPVICRKRARQDLVKLIESDNEILRGRVRESKGGYSIAPSNKMINFLQDYLREDRLLVLEKRPYNRKSKEEKEKERREREQRDRIRTMGKNISYFLRPYKLSERREQYAIQEINDRLYSGKGTNSINQDYGVFTHGHRLVPNKKTREFIRKVMKEMKLS